MPMTPRERLFAALRREPVDRVPVWLLFPYHPTGYYVDVGHLPVYQKVVEASYRQSITLNRRNLYVPLFEPGVKAGQEEIYEQGERVQRFWYEWKGHRLTRERREGPGGVSIKKLLSTDADLELFCAMPLEQDPKRIAAALERQLPRYEAERAEFPAELGAMMLDLAEPVGPLYTNSKLEAFALWSMTHADTVKDFLLHRMEQLRHLYGFCLERQLAEVYFMVDSELAAPPLVTHETFQHWNVPFSCELHGMIRDAGSFVVQHFHGQIRGLLEDFALMAPDALHTIEAPPIGDCTLEEAFEKTGANITLIGNVQYDDFRALEPAAMAAHVRGILDACKGKPLILSPTAGPFDENPPERLIENYLVFLQTAWDFPWP